MRVRKSIVAAVAAIAMTGVVSSCVPTSKYQEQQRASSSKQKKIESQEVEIDQLKKNIAQLKRDLAAAQKASDILAQDTSLAGIRNRTLSNRLNVLENDLKALTAKMGDVPEYRSLMQHLSQMQDELADSQDKLLDSEKAAELNRKKLREANSALAESEKQLQESEKQLEASNADIARKQKTIADQEAALAGARKDIERQAQQLREMEAALKAKDEAMASLRNKIATALNDFNPDELTVVHKDGKVYVSLEEKLLFASGKYDVNEKGKQAIAKIAQVLKTTDAQMDINVEGHTDNVPLKGQVIEDNWDLSVKRATSVVRLLIAGGLQAERIEAAGRADTKPVAPNTTDEGRRKNRRTEIVLSPKIEELLKQIAD
jgi:chemotaxis protein MotB